MRPQFIVEFLDIFLSHQLLLLFLSLLPLGFLFFLNQIAVIFLVLFFLQNFARISIL